MGRIGVLALGVLGSSVLILLLCRLSMLRRLGLLLPLLPGLLLWLGVLRLLGLLLLRLLCALGLRPLLLLDLLLRLSVLRLVGLLFRLLRAGGLLLLLLNMRLCGLRFGPRLFVLARLRFGMARLLTPLLLQCKRRSSDYEKQRQDGRAGDSKYFHGHSPSLHFLPA